MAQTNSNYTQQALAARSLFLQWDQAAMIAKYGLKADETYLYLFFVGAQYRIHRRTGQVDRDFNGSFQECLGFEEVMSLYDLLCRENQPFLSGEYCSIYSLPNVVLSSGLGQNIFTDAAKWFQGNSQKLRQACLALGGTSLPGSADAAFQIPVFPFFPVILQFWDGDEEFDPQLTLLWDKNTQQFFRYETTYYLAGHLPKRLRELASQT